MLSSLWFWRLRWTLTRLWRFATKRVGRHRPHHSGSEPDSMGCVGSVPIGSHLIDPRWDAFRQDAIARQRQQAVIKVGMPLASDATSRSDATSDTASIIAECEKQPGRKADEEAEAEPLIIKRPELLAAPPERQRATPGGEHGDVEVGRGEGATIPEMFSNVAAAISQSFRLPSSQSKVEGTTMARIAEDAEQKDAIAAASAAALQA